MGREREEGMAGAGAGATIRGGRQAARPLLPRFLRLGPLLLLAALVAGFLGWQLSYRALLTRLDQSLILARHALTLEIERFRYLPAVAGEDARIRAALASPGAPEAIEAANLYLQTLVQTSGATHLYLLDAQGRTLAASNWALPESFIGKNYSFRPYFRDALAQGHGAFYAIGVTTGLPGYFLAARVVLPNGTPGVVVVKIDLSRLQETWSRAEQDTAVTDADGVIFLASDPGWLYRPLRALPAEVTARLESQQTYAGIDIAGAAPLMEPLMPPLILGQNGLILGKNGRMLASSAVAIGSGWRVVAATPLAPALVIAGLAAALGGLLAAMVAGLDKIRRQRRALLHLERHQSALLERRVAERTAALHLEAEARRETEAELRAAQESLIQSEKMAALGRMSTAIVHEISQPLAAMEATLLTAGMLAEAPSEAAIPEALRRIETARGLVRRMQRTTRRLKSFAQKEAMPTEPVDLLAVIEGALEVVQPRARAVGVMPQLRPVVASCRVQAGRVRLEQVLVNLLLNALDAVEGRAGAWVELDLQIGADEACILVADNGPGIAPELLARVAEPFFTTKAQSEGLGLGLAISTEIITAFGGHIALSARPGGGVNAELCLPRLPEPATAEPEPATGPEKARR